MAFAGLRSVGDARSRRGTDGTHHDRAADRPASLAGGRRRPRSRPRRSERLAPVRHACSASGSARPTTSRAFFGEDADWRVRAGRVEEALATIRESLPRPAGVGERRVAAQAAVPRCRSRRRRVPDSSGRREVEAASRPARRRPRSHRSLNALVLTSRCGASTTTERESSPTTSRRASPGGSSGLPASARRASPHRGRRSAPVHPGRDAVASPG